MWSALAAVVLVQAAAVLGAWALQAREPLLRRGLPVLVSLAVGVLLATGLLHLLPEAVTALGNRPMLWMILGGTILALFCAERLTYALTGAPVEPELQLGHAHTHTHGTKPTGILTASMLHSLIDGTAVAAAFAAGPRIGWLTAFAIALHEIPHRIGDFALFVHLHIPAPKALRYAVLAGAPSLLGVALVWIAGQSGAAALNLLLPVSAGSFLYIALVSLLPELEHERHSGALAVQIIGLLAGVGLVALAGLIFPS